jgi:hypothetical protein
MEPRQDRHEPVSASNLAEMSPEGKQSFGSEAQHLSIFTETTKP